MDTQKKNKGVSIYHGDKEAKPGLEMTDGWPTLTAALLNGGCWPGALARLVPSSVKIDDLPPLLTILRARVAKHFRVLHAVAGKQGHPVAAKACPSERRSGTEQSSRFGATRL